MARRPQPALLLAQHSARQARAPTSSSKLLLPSKASSRADVPHLLETPRTSYLLPSYTLWLQLLKNGGKTFHHLKRDYLALFFLLRKVKMKGLSGTGSARK